MPKCVLLRAATMPMPSFFAFSIAISIDLLRDDHTHPVVPVDDCCRRALSDHLELGDGALLLRLDAVVVDGLEAADTVAVDTLPVCSDEHVRTYLGVALGYTHLPEDVDHEATELLDLYPDYFRHVLPA